MVQTPQFWENESLDALDGMRRELREIVHLLKEQRQNKKFVIDIEDEYTTSKAPRQRGYTDYVQAASNRLLGREQQQRNTAKDTEL